MCNVPDIVCACTNTDTIFSSSTNKYCYFAFKDSTRKVGDGDVEDGRSADYLLVLTQAPHFHHPLTKIIPLYSRIVQGR